MKVVSLAISEKKGISKHEVDVVELLEDHGIKGDAHAGPWHRQVSFLASEAIERVKSKGYDIGFGDFAENIATEGIEWPNVSVGTIVKIGDSVVIEITQIGKKCHTKCAIYQMAGDCIMPREGVFGRVIRGGKISRGDYIQIHRPPHVP